MTMNRVWTGLSGGLLALALVGLLLQHRALEQLRAENARLAEASGTAKGDPNLVEPDPGANGSAGPNSGQELERLRAEVLRLRGQLAASRQTTPKARPNLTTPASSTPAAEAGRFSVHATIPAGHLLVTGGWELAPGKRLLVLVTPTITASADGPPSVTLVPSMFEAPDEVLDGLGFAEFRADSAPLRPRRIVDAEAAQTLLERLKQTGQVSLLMAPAISTLSGGQAQVGFTTTDRPEGLNIDVLPKVSADGQNVELSIGIDGLTGK